MGTEMSVAKDKREFEIAAEGLPSFDGVDLDADVVCIEPVDAAYFKNGVTKQRCIIRRADGKLYLANYE